MGAAAQVRPLPLLEEARAIYNLIADGHHRLRYHVSRGCALRDADTKRALVSSQVPRGEWRPARDVAADGSERDRSLNPYVLRKHLLGSYDVAFEWPSWTSLIVFDIDRHLPGGASAAETHPELVKLANEQRDETMERLWRALRLEGKDPVVLQTPGGGYHVYLPLNRGATVTGERTWPAAWIRERVEHQLNQHGMALRPGVLELFPAGPRLRAPCGQGMVLVDSEDQEPVEGTFEDRRQGRVRRISPMVRAFCEAIEQSRKPLDEWLDQPGASWDPVWGPWGDRKKIGPLTQGVMPPSRNEVDVSERTVGRSPVPGNGCLLHGTEFLDRVQELARDGLTEPGERHDAVLKLIWYWMICRRLSSDDALDRLSEWLQRRSHVSHLLPHNPRKFYRDSMREAAHYAAQLDRPSPTAKRISVSVDVAPRPLTDAEQVVLVRIPLVCRDDAAVILGFLRAQANPQGRVLHAVSLGTRILEALCGDHRVSVELDGRRSRRRRYILAVEHLVALGVLALHTNYSVGRHGKLYTCWYQFGSGRLPVTDDEDLLVLAERDVEEGRLQVVSDGAQPPTVQLEPNDGLMEALATAPLSERPATPWWARMFSRRIFTPAEFLEADARKVIPGPFRHRYPASAYRPPAGPPAPDTPEPPTPSSPTLPAPDVPDTPPDASGILPAEIEDLLAALPASMRGQARASWIAWLRYEDTS